VLAFCLLINFFIFCAMAGGKHAPEGKSEPPRKHNAIYFERKLE
jgi:hypothetical protein